MGRKPPVFVIIISTGDRTLLNPIISIKSEHIELCFAPLLTRRAGYILTSASNLNKPKIEHYFQFTSPSTSPETDVCYVVVATQISQEDLTLFFKYFVTKAAFVVAAFDYR